MQPLNYDELAASYDRRYEEYAYVGIEWTLSDFVGLGAGRSVLEVGCGTGHWLARLERDGLSLAGLDPSLEMLRRARTWVPAADLRTGRAEQIPWEAGSFERVICIHALHHFDCAPAFFVEARRVLRAGGGLLVVGLDPHTRLDRWSIYDYFEGTRQRDMRRYPATSQIVQWMREAGFSDCSISEVERIRLRLPARDAIQRGRLDRGATSQLALLSDGEYERGMQALWSEIARREARGERLELVADLRLYGTRGWLLPRRRDPAKDGVQTSGFGTTI
jgi:SAM-dependent methyltransferase